MSMQGGFMNRIMNDNKKSYKLKDINKNVLKMFLNYLKPHIGFLIVIFIIMSIVALVNTFIPFLSKIAIDEYIKNKNIKGLHLVLAGYILGYIIFWIASYWGSYFSIKLGQNVIKSVREDLFSHIISLDMKFFNNSKTGEIVTRLTNDINSLSDFISNGVVNVVSDILTLAGIITFMVILNSKLALIVLITIPVIFFGTTFLGKKMRKAYSSVRKKTGAMNAGIQENLSGIKVVKSMSKESENTESFEKINRENLYARIKAALVSALFFPFMSLTGTIGTSLTILAGGIMVINQQPGASIGVIIAFIGYTNRFFLPLRDMSQIYNVYQEAAASAERIYEYLNIQNNIKFTNNPIKPNKKIDSTIEFNNISFEYNENEPVIKNISLKIPSNSITAIVGPTGAGKSTLIKLIDRFYDTTKGNIKIDGVNIKEMDLSSLRSKIMIVPQDVFLFNESIKNNIRYGNKNVSDSDIIKAARDACADTFIEKLPNGYDTVVGEGGVFLSGGQKQLIAFSRAILADRPIIIFDEATSSVDAHTESLIQKALENIIKDKTTIIIAHRFTTLKKAKQILVMNEGQVAGFGTHNSLLQSCNIYKELYKKQWLT